MQVGRAKISIRRFVFVEASHGGVGEENASAPVRLQAVLMGIDHDRIHFAEAFTSLPRGCTQIVRQSKITTVSSVRVYAERPELYYSMLIEGVSYIERTFSWERAAAGYVRYCMGRGDDSGVVPSMLG